MAANEESDVLECWEEMEDSEVFDRKLQGMQPETSEDSDVIKNGPFPVQVDDSFRMPYGALEPAVKILKRPPKNLNGNGDGVQLNGDLKPRQPVKTLQQREQEYAEARLRILGEARSPEESVVIATSDDLIGGIQSKMEILRTSENPNIIRLPKGPDGTKGFNLRR